MSQDAKRLLSVADFVERYSIGRTTAFKEMASGRLRSVMVCGLRRIRIEDAEAWLKFYAEKRC
ncbi:hypothetical protein [Oryzibacter oryziterrae]|uniref:hypothetical protein n=1 Tax=Oryzibacter oryziterrae TaxID=2766474 RepID=UPI001F3A5CD4|nr:hypothetical protein [Oryzibacter oryziterrae]